MESRVGAVAERDGLILILQEVLNVAHLMVHSDEVVQGHHCALLDPRDGTRMGKVNSEIYKTARGKEKARQFLFQMSLQL